MTLCSRDLALLLAIVAIPAAGGSQSLVNLGLVRLSVHETRSVQVTHIVDQLADWDNRTHRSYLRWAADSLLPDSTDRALLARHAHLRRRYGYKRDVDPAILAHFAARLAPMLDTAAPRVHAFAERLAAAGDSIHAVMQPVIKLSGRTTRLALPVYLVANPIAGTRGGHFAGGSVIVEVPVRPDAIFSLYHELFHALVAPHQARVRSVAASSHLTFDELNEALAYAFSPGLTDDVPDQLSRQLANASNPSAHRMLAAAVQLRPLLHDALETGASMQSFLSRAGAMLSRSSLF